MNTWIIKDWTGAIKFKGKAFKSFEDGEEYLCNYFHREKIDYEEWRGEYYIEQIKYEGEE